MNSANGKLSVFFSNLLPFIHSFIYWNIIFSQIRQQWQNSPYLASRSCSHHRKMTLRAWFPWSFSTTSGLFIHQQVCHLNKSALMVSYIIKHSLIIDIKLGFLLQTSIFIDFNFSVGSSIVLRHSHSTDLQRE